jgi:hypothetical protein
MKLTSATQRSVPEYQHLNEVAEHREHRKAAILDLLDLELSKGVWVICKACSTHACQQAARSVSWAVTATDGMALCHSCGKPNLHVGRTMTVSSPMLAMQRPG